MTPEESKALWGEVERNHAALKACAGPHDFQDITPGKTIGKDYQCAKCGGKAGSLHVSWYQEGLKHGKL